jgi:integrase
MMCGRIAARQRASLQQKTGVAQTTRQKIAHLVFLKDAAAVYMADLRSNNNKEMAHQAEYLFEGLLSLPRLNKGHIPMHAITRQDILDWHNALRSKGLKERTIKNRHVILKHFLKFSKITVADMPSAPHVVKRDPQICEDEQMTALLTACDPYTRVLVEMGRQLGLRKRELMFAAWTDISWANAEFKVTEKPDLAFTIKNRKERTLPMSPSLTALLKEWRETRPHTRLILETRTGKPHQSLLNKLKATVIKAGLPPEDFSLHMLRRKFVSTLLERGVDIKTASKMVDHASIATTALYAAALDRKKQAEHVTRIFG